MQRFFRCQIRFSYRKLFIDVKGTFVSQTRLTCLTPNFTDTGIPPGTVDVRVCLAGESFTTTKAEFTFFPVTDANFSFLYGPSLLEEGVPGRETMFIIQVPPYMLLSFFSCLCPLCLQLN